MAGEPQDRSRRTTLTALTAAAGGIAAGGAAIPFVLSFGPSERAKAAGGPVEVDLGAIKHSELHTVEWRGQPVWILKRSPDMLQRLSSAAPLPVPRFQIRPGRPRVPWLASTDQPRHSAASLPLRDNDSRGRRVTLAPPLFSMFGNERTAARYAPSLTPINAR